MAYVAAAAAAVPLIALSVLALRARWLPLPLWVLYLLLPTVLVPLTVLSAVAAYPRSVAARRARAEDAQGGLLVQYLVLALQQRPSLPDALRFCGEHLPAPLGQRIRRLQWGVMLHDHEGFEEGFAALAEDLGSRSEALRQSLYLVSAASLEETDEGRQRKLEQALETVLEGQHDQHRAFVASLGGPLSALFALGVLLPLVLGTMLPLGAVSGMALTTAQVAVLFVVAVPAATGAMAWWILQRRPVSVGLGAAPPLAALGARQWSALVATAVGGSLLALVVLPSLPQPWAGLWLLVLVAAAAAGVGLWGHLRTAVAATQAVALARLRADLPDALFQLGSRLAEGRSLEAALAMTGRRLGKAPSGPLLRGLARQLQLGHTTLDDLIDRHGGWLGRYPLPSLRPALRLVVRATARDAQTGGRLVTRLALALRRSEQLERAGAAELQRVAGPMAATVVLFAPIVLAVTAILYGVLGSTLQTATALGSAGGGVLGSGGPAIAPDHFLGLLGLYLLLLALVVLGFLGRLRGTEATAVTVRSACLGAAGAVGLFTAAVVVGLVL